MNESLRSAIRACLFCDDAGHWHWQGSVTGSGQPIIRWQTRMLTARRTLYIDLHGPLPTEHRVVRRTCSVPLCVSPHHAESAPSASHGRTASIQDRVLGNLCPAGECLLWTGPLDSCGRITISRQGKKLRLARALWEDQHGPLPAGMVVHHTCGRTACFASHHLAAAKAAAVVRTTASTGAFAGENHWNHRLTTDQVLAIRASSLPGAALADRYHVSMSTVRAIRSRKRWQRL